ncbi:Integron integrase [Dissulfuribacter thermophilus]|uniref:Integron integrase n=1 Tax=Dissulfuribacter thermophilus TaxID=1156395 RepID=A0A1B9F967_9BACT|nr:Integron integrase [Dissulfuribacter thermophilus]
MRLKRRSYRTEQAYLAWIDRFKLFSKKPVDEISGTDVQDFLTYLVVEKRIAGSTQNQALHALVFLFRHVLDREIEPYIDAVRAKERRRLPVVLTKTEVQLVLNNLKGVYGLIGRIMYGGGLRLNEAIRLRVKDIDEERRIINVREGKGGKDRITLLPEAILEDLKSHLKTVKKLYKSDRQNSIAGVKMPDALERKYPEAGKEWAWFWIFPSQRLSVDPLSLVIRRHHINPTGVQRSFKQALKSSGITKNATVHTLRHSFATHLLEDGYDIRTVQELLGHKSVQTTMIYTHVAKKNILGVRSPLDN